MKRNRWSVLLCAVDGRTVVGLAKPRARQPEKAVVKFPYDGDTWTSVAATKKVEECIRKREPYYV